MSEYRPPTTGNLNWDYDADSTGWPYAFDGHLMTDLEIGTLLGELRWLALVTDANEPPWAGDMTAVDVYERTVPRFGKVWYTFLADPGSALCKVVVLRSTLKRTQTDASVAQSRLDAERRVAVFRALGLVC